MHESQAKPVTKALQTHCPVVLSQGTLVLVPLLLQAQGLHRYDAAVTSKQAGMHDHTARIKSQ